MTTTPASDNCFEDFALALMSLASTTDPVERFDIQADIEKIIGTIGDSAARIEMRFVTDAVISASAQHC